MHININALVSLLKREQDLILPVLLARASSMMLAFFYPILTHQLNITSLTGTAAEPLSAILTRPGRFRHFPRQEPRKTSQMISARLHDYARK